MKKWISLLVSLVMLAGLLGSASAGEPLSASVSGFGGEVTVTVELDDEGKIVTITADGSTQTPELGGNAAAALNEGALAALAASLLGASVPIQIALFLVVSAALLFCLRGAVRKHFTPRLVRTNIDAVVDSRGYVTADIDNVSATGSIKLGAMEWTARSTSGAALPKGTLVKVDKIEGVKVFVSPVEAEIPVL